MGEKRNQPFQLADAGRGWRQGKLAPVIAKERIDLTQLSVD
jgi:hypothetical protein